MFKLMTDKNLTMFSVMLLKNVYAKDILMKRYEDETVKIIKEKKELPPGIEPVTFCLWDRSDSNELPEIPLLKYSMDIFQ